MINFDLNKISDICAQYSGSDYYVEDMIPAAKLANARSAFPMPAREYVFAFVNSTVFGSGKNGLAIAATGIYWHNDWTTDTAKKYLPWDEFIYVDIKKKGWYDLELGPGNVFNMSGCSFKKEDLIDLLTTIQNYVRRELLGAPSPAARTQATPAAPAAAAPVPPAAPTVQAPPPAPSPATEWMVAIAGQQYGPYDLSLLKMMVETNQIRPQEAHVWKQGMPAWVPFLQQPELAALVAPPMPPAPPAPPVPPAPQTPPPAPSLAPFEQAVAAAQEASSFASASQEANATGRIDLNTASWEALLELPGIGAVGAKRLIQEREAIGGFHSVEEVGRVLGLKPHHVEKLRDLVEFRPLQVKTTGGRLVDY